MMVSSIATTHDREVASGDRFKFGENWARFLTVVTEDRIRAAENSLSAMLGFPLAGKSFIDVGSGSGLFSLAARRLGARVYSFDSDSESVACTLELKRRYATNDLLWTVEHGSVLDVDYLSSLGKFDIVYAWGVLHHTGAMWRALENVTPLVGEGGTLFIAIYNDQGTASRRWTRIKKFYNTSSGPVQRLFLFALCVWMSWRRWITDLLRLRAPQTWINDDRARGMSAWYDLVDWVGGYPFEVAKPEEIFRFYRSRGFVLEQLQT